MVAILYMFIGLFMGWIVREVFYVPHDFYYGILVVRLRCRFWFVADMLDVDSVKLGFVEPS